VVHVDAPAARFIDRFGDIERFERGPGVPQIGRFGTPPRLEDLASLTLPAKDVAALKTCRPGDCDVKLSTAAMIRFRNQVNWSSPRRGAAGHEVARDDPRAGARVSGERQRGARPLRRWQRTAARRRAVPRPPRQQPTADFRCPSSWRIWTSTRAAARRAPKIPFTGRWSTSASSRPSGSTTWSSIRWPARPVGCLARHRDQAALCEPLLPHDARASVPVRDERQADRRGFYLLSITRSRSDGTTGLTGSLLRPVISRRSRNAVRGYLEHLKATTGRACRIKSSS
jgi:hypothetical protein